MVSRFWQWSDAINNELHVLINHAYALKDAAKAHSILRDEQRQGHYFEALTPSSLPRWSSP